MILGTCWAGVLLPGSLPFCQALPSSGTLMFPLLNSLRRFIAYITRPVTESSSNRPRHPPPRLRWRSTLCLPGTSQKPRLLAKSSINCPPSPPSFQYSPNLMVPSHPAIPFESSSALKPFSNTGSGQIRLFRCPSFRWDR